MQLNQYHPSLTDTFTNNCSIYFDSHDLDIENAKLRSQQNEWISNSQLLELESKIKTLKSEVIFYTMLVFIYGIIYIH